MSAQQMREGSHTPWGPVQDVEHLGAGVARVGTASHGGLHVTGAAANAVPAVVWAAMMNGRGWAEEDCELVIVATLLMDAGHITCPRYLEHRDDARDAARTMASRYERYASIRIPDEPTTDPGFPVAVAGMLFPAC